MNPAVRVSKRTWVIALGGLGLTALVYLMIVLRVGGDTGVVAFSDLGEASIMVLSTAIVIWAATRFSPGEPLFKQWLLIGIGIGLFTVGDIVWAIIEVGLGQEVPYPGVPDVFYVAEYLFFSAGLILAALAYRRLIDIRVSLLLSSAAVLVLAIPLHIYVLSGIVTDSEIGLVEKALSAFYPLGDLILQLGPALLIILVVSRLGGGSLGWPWWAVAIGIALFAISDTTYSYLSAQDLYRSGNIIDTGWMMGGVLVATGASLARDVAAPIPRRSGS